MASDSRLLVVFSKFPEPGFVKSRLAASIGPEAAAAVYQRLVAHTFRAFSGIDSFLWIYADPSDRLSDVECWLRNLVALPKGTEFIPQAAGDLGQRLDYLFRAAFARGFGKVIAIGTDCAGLTADHLSSAWLALDSADAVFGPALDGGYYLIGLRQLAPQLFHNIPWSSPETLSDSIRAAEESHLSFHLLAPLRDVDTLNDLQAEPWLMDDAEGSTAGQ